MQRYRRQRQKLEKKVANLESEISSQRLLLEILYEFCRSVANREKTSLLSYQQLNSPSTNSRKKVRMLLKKIRELG